MYAAHAAPNELGFAAIRKCPALVGTLRSVELCVGAQEGEFIDVFLLPMEGLYAALKVSFKTFPDWLAPEPPLKQCFERHVPTAALHMSQITRLCAVRRAPPVHAEDPVRAHLPCRRCRPKRGATWMRGS